MFQQPAYIFDLIAPYIPLSSLIDPRSNKNSLPQHIRSSDSLSAFQGLLKTFLYQKSLPPKLSIACTMSPRFWIYALTMDSRPSLPCISHIQNIWIAWKGHPRCLHLKTKRALYSLLLLPDGVTLKTSPRGWMATARAYATRNSVHCPPPPPDFKT